MKKTNKISLAERLDDERLKTRARVASWGKSHRKRARASQKILAKKHATTILFSRKRLQTK